MTEHDLTLSRRALIGAAAAAGLSAAFGARALAALGADSENVTTCLLAPEVTEGPYWIDNKLTRRDVREGKPGAPLVLELTIVNAKTCKAIRNADVEIWHADAAGDYSGFDGGSDGAQSKTRYLRGHQRSNSLGQASFLTVFPGWYPGRTPHIHLKAHIGQDRVVHTGQVFFNEAIAAQVYRHGVYAGRGQPDTPHARDMIYAQAGGTRAVARLSKRVAGGYVGKIVIGVTA
jgi:protocatechuate 3,4-dioxygenase beta subunit